MNDLVNYINKILGFKIKPIKYTESRLLPIYINEVYNLYKANMLNSEVLVAELKNNNVLSIQQTDKHVTFLKNLLNMNVVIVLSSIESYNRKRLIEKKINFIVPGKQMYLPDLLIDLRESFQSGRTKQEEKLLPSSQVLLLYHLLHISDQWKIEGHSFKEIALKFGYTPMAITNAMENLNYHKLVVIEGEKEKFANFTGRRIDLWNNALAREILINPLIKTIFVDNLPHDLLLYGSNTTALTEYSDINPTSRTYYAVEKNVFYSLQKKNVLKNQNLSEGKFALELWKYDPGKLINLLPNNKKVVDPISLYLSMRNYTDERVEMALTKIIESHIW